MVVDKTTIIQRLKYTLYTINTISKSHTVLKIYIMYLRPLHGKIWNNSKKKASSLIYTITRGSKEPVSLTLVYVTIKQRKQMDSWQNCILEIWWWWCVCTSYFTEHLCCLQLSLSIMNLAQEFQWKM